jgi:hypothetical protein
VSPSHSFRRVSLGGLTVIACLLLGACLVLTGCSPSGGSAGQGQTSQSPGATTQTAPTGIPTQLTLDTAASQGSRPSRSAPTRFASKWFPPTDTDGLTDITSAKQRSDLVAWAEADPNFWLAQNGLSDQPLLTGSDALKAAKQSSFDSALVVEVKRLKPVLPTPRPATIAASVDDTPASYQVLLTGKAGISSYGVSATQTAGEWSLDSQGELVNWSTALDVVSKIKGFTPVSAYIVRTVYDLGGRPALYVSWAVFSDGGGHEYAATLHAPPQINATWKLGGKQFGLGIAYPATAIYGPITATPTSGSGGGSTTATQPSQSL